MRRAIPYITIVLILALIYGCSAPQQRNVVYVTIPPLKQLVEEIVGDDYEVEVILPQGASPETFELSARKMVEIGSAQWVFATSLLDFEKAIMQRIGDDVRVVDISRNIELIEGECHHHHHTPNSTAKPLEKGKHWAAEHASHHHHGIDPHIWASPRSLMHIARNIYEAIETAMPDSVKYHERYIRLGEQLLDLDEECSELCKTARKPYFIIYHPALTYLARDYGLEQVAIENDGKEASVKRIAQIIDKARQDGIQRIFYQREFPRSTVETVCRDIGAEPVEIDPLAENCIENIRHIVHQICQ